MIIHSVGTYYNELDFLTHIPILNNHDNRDSIFNDVIGENSFDKAGNEIKPKSNTDSARSVVFKNKDIVGTEQIKNHYAENVNKGNDDDLNIYLKLIRDFEAKGFESLRYKAADFTYLKELGVYPINRMWTLRRFTDGYSVPDNLQDWYDTTKFTAGSTSDTKPEAISTMVGWIEPDEENFFGINFNEEWVTVTDRLDQVMMKVLQEFGFKGSAVPVPGFSQGLLFGFLNEMGITDYSSKKIPMGDPNVIQEGASRANNADPGFGLKSGISVKLETEYEQKFIGDIDPGSAMLDLIKNCTTMGTSESKSILNGNSDVLSTLATAINNPTSVDAWWDFIKITVDAFINAITKLFKGDGDNEGVGDNFFGPSGTTAGADNSNKKKKIENGLTDKLDNIKSLSNGIMESILASTVAKWRWALKGSLALMTGQNSTPWHLTLGNPYSPFVTMGNIVVEKMDLKFNNEFAFNDIPTNLKIEITVKLGRNIGAQEIFQMFNNGYKRIYNNDTKKSISNAENVGLLAEEKQKTNGTASNTTNISVPNSNTNTNTTTNVE